jgi:hypothetical protein
LVIALENNPYVPAYLLGRKKLPRRRPDSVGFGDDSEAFCYAADNPTMPWDNGGRLDQNHRVQTARPQSMEPDPEHAIDSKESRPPGRCGAKNVQVMTESEVLQF